MHCAVARCAASLPGVDVSDLPARREMWDTVAARRRL
jgi:hypothetical protein